MQYTKLGFNRLFKGYGSLQVPCSLIVNRSVTPTLHIASRCAKHKKTTTQRAICFLKRENKKHTNGYHRLNCTFASTVARADTSACKSGAVSMLNWAVYLPTHHPNIVENFFWTFFVHVIIILIFGQYLTSMMAIKNTKTFGEHLRQLREEAGLTLKFVSEQISIDT